MAGNAFLAATMIQGLFVLNIENYVYEKWHGSLLTLAILLISVTFNTILARRLPIVEGVFVFCHILGILIFLPVMILSPRRDGSSPLTEFYNPGGWASNGLSTMIGTVGPISALIGFDCSVHMGMLNPLTCYLLLLTYLPYSRGG
jgi:amino acid transporter